MLNEKLLRQRISCWDRKKKGLQGRILCCDTVLRSRHKKKTIMVATDYGCRDQEVMLKGLTRSLPGNLRLRQRYKLETPIKVVTRYLCRDYI